MEDLSSLETTMNNGYLRLPAEERQTMEDYCTRYKQYLTHCRTERTTVAGTIRLAEANGFRPYEPGTPLAAGDRIYFNNKNHGMFLAVIGREPLSAGVSIAASHVDSPRLDVRPRPLFETGEMAFFRTHYYGWVRKYQWFSLPLMLLGVVILRNGETVEVSVGDEPGDPKLVIPDLLPHIADEQNKLPLSEAHTGEKMNVLLGSEPLPDCAEGKAVKLHILRLLNEKYGIREDDLISSELEIVPAMPVSDVGLDRSFIGAYGQDDRVCGYAALDALFSLGTPRRTAVCIFADKEEVGNNGVSGMLSATYDYYLELLCRAQGCGFTDCLQRSFCLSADVTSAYDPSFAECFEPQNAAHVNYGVAICKYTGHGGKEQASDATAETVGFVRKLFEENGVIYQSAEMSRIDLGGGGTVALTLANRGIETLDAGVPVLGMHSPFEVTSKLDCYMTHKACKALYEY